ncbi:MAG: hypothetical protein KF767_16540 [Bdellovibrionaceae bacterium]|nr:hypothetical protein [Pseudobdellovibrionaceae bacterium]
MGQNIPLIAAFCVFVGLVMGYALNAARNRRRFDEDEKSFNEVQVRAMGLQADHQGMQVRLAEFAEQVAQLQSDKEKLTESNAQLQAQVGMLEAQRLELKEQVGRLDTESNSKNSRLREVELELERLKLHDSSRAETESTLRALEIEHRANLEKLQSESSQRQLLDSRLSDNYQALQQTKQEYDRRLMEKETDLKQKEQSIKDLHTRVSGLEADNRRLNEEQMKAVATLTLAHDELNREKAEIRANEERRRQEAFEKRKANWINHENSMIEVLKNLCKRLEIVYHDKKTFPLLRKPDFAIEVAGQYVVLDAKAPADPERPENFYDYLKRQAEGLEKYLKQEGVRRDGFLVVPTDSLPYLQERFFYEIGASKVYVVTPESLEPALRLLLKIEEYDILQALGPEAQDDIATYIGQASRMIKRRVQIDHYMSDKFIELLKSGEALPEEIAEKAKSKEKNFHFNPPKLDRGKPLTREELEKKQSQVGFQVDGMEINQKLAADVLEKIPLNRDEAPAPQIAATEEKADEAEDSADEDAS